MSALVQRRARSPDPERPPSFSTSLISVFETCSAGARPKMNAVPRQIAARNANTMPSSVNLIQYGFPTSATAASKSRMPMIDNPNPSTPLRIASRTLSTSSCRTMRNRVAPSEMRTEISRARFADRARSRFATFAHAIRRTKPTAPISVRKISLIWPPLYRSLNVITVGLMSLFVAGKSCASRSAIVLSSACACAVVTPLASRANTWKFRASRF